MKKTCIFLLILLSIANLGAAERYYQNIFNASYHSDFAFGAFPLSLWADFGIAGLELLPGNNTKFYTRVMAGLTERTLRQNPLTGYPLENGGHGYSVVYSDGSIVFDQQIMRNPLTGGTMFSVKLSARMRWEQAFATFREIRDENYAGIFKPELGLFPAGGNVFLPGTPELSGDKYFVSNSINVGIVFDNSVGNNFFSDGYGFSLDVIMAPFWLINDLWFIDEVYTDAYRIDLNGYYNVTFLHETYGEDDKNQYSLYMHNRVDTSYVTGESIPRYLGDRLFMGSYVVPREYYVSYHSELVFCGPEFITKATYPKVYISLDNAISVGPMVNCPSIDKNLNFYGGFSVGAEISIFGYFKANFNYIYIYTDNPGSPSGGGFNMGVTLNLFI